MTQQVTAHHLRRLIGTIVGGVLAAGLVVVVHSSLLIYIIVAITAFLTFAYFSGSYGLCMTFMTIFVIMILNLFASGNWHIPFIRVTQTLIGVLLVSLAISLEWTMKSGVARNRKKTR